VWILTRELWLGVITLGLAIVAPYTLISIFYKRRLQTIEKQLPDAMIMLSASMRAGASFTTALDSLIQESSPPLSQEFSLLLREIRLGVDMDTALNHIEQRIPLEDFRLLLSAIRISREVGGNLAENMDKLAATLRTKLVMEGKVRSLTAQGRLQGVVMSLLPKVLVAILMKLEPTAMGMLFTTRIGWAVLALILVMQVLGFLVILKLPRLTYDADSHFRLCRTFRSFPGSLAEPAFDPRSRRRPGV
jgi:tight adherence protein B